VFIKNGKCFASIPVDFIHNGTSMVWNCEKISQIFDCQTNESPSRGRVVDDYYYHHHVWLLVQVCVGYPPKSEKFIFSLLSCDTQRYPPGICWVSWENIPMDIMGNTYGEK
jgi:hypothetical protein